MNQNIEGAVTRNVVEEEETAESVAAAAARALIPGSFAALCAGVPPPPRSEPAWMQSLQDPKEALDVDKWIENIEKPKRYKMRQAAQDLTEWDLRAKMEKRRRQERERAEWNEARAMLGRRPAHAADWRTDARCVEAGTGDPTDPDYREWSNREIWDLITLKGVSFDPRGYPLRVEDPNALGDAVAEGAAYVEDFVEMLERMGRIMPEAEEEKIVDKAGEEALLDSAFTGGCACGKQKGGRGSWGASACRK